MAINSGSFPKALTGAKKGKTPSKTPVPAGNLGKMFMKKGRGKS